MTARWPSIALAIAGALWTAALQDGAVRATGQPPATGPAPASPSPLVAPSGEYVGASACRECHADIHGTWTRGRHSKMLQPATRATVVGDFSKGELTLAGRRYRVAARDGAFYITESDLGPEPRDHRVEYTLGSRRVQHYLTTLDDGQIVVLPPTWDVTWQRWFHNSEIVRPAEADERIVQQWNRHCVGCHVSGQDTGYDPGTRTYHTQWTDFGTSCERCHGPGRQHVIAARATPRTAAASIVRPTRLDANHASMVCAQCHSLRTVINPGFTAGADYYDFFIPALEFAIDARPRGSQDPPYWPDGRPRRFSNDAIGLWQSACFLRGGATCTTCHVDPHLPDIDRNPQLAPAAGNALCASCHRAIAAQPAAHTRHAPDSPGSSCIECHMPKTVVSLKATMRDHTLSVPAPENTVRFGIPNACTECHRDKRASWAVSVMRSWWPEGRRQRLIAQAEAFAAARAGRDEAVPRLVAIAEDRSYPPLIRANAIGYLGRFSDPRALEAIVRAVRGGEPVIRLMGVAALRGPAPRTPDARAAILDALQDPRRAVRVAAALTLAERGGSDLPMADRPRLRAVSREIAAWTRQHTDDPGLQRLAGVVHLLAGNIDAGASALSLSLDHDPTAAETRFLLGLARVAQGRREEARQLFKQVPRGHAYHASAQQQLQKLEQERQPRRN